MNKPRILHLGDLHFFRNKRFEEFRLLINQAVEVIKKNNIDLVYIGGDIIDSKNKLSPEQIELVTEFLYSLSNWCPIVMIPGNHDAMLSNKDTLDSLTPIVDNIDSVNPIYYLKETGIYDLYNIKWAVWSCLDDLNPMEGYVKQPTDYIIGCFHGPVNGCTTESGFSSFPHSPSIDIFENCDTVFLADIHKRQSFRNGDIAYCGSWTQVTIGEFEIKGALIWDWNQKYKSKFVEFENPYRYETIKIDNLSKFKIEDVKPKSKNATYRFLYVGNEEDFSSLEFNEVKKSFVKANSDNPVILQKAFARKKAVIKKADNKVKNTSIDYLKKYFDKKDTDVKLQPLLIDIDNELTKQLDLSDFQTGEYYIKQLTIHNFLSYGPNNVLNWDNLQGLIGLFGKSTLGKSSIPHAILFCLFNRTPKDSSSVNKLVNDQIQDGQKAFVELILNINGNSWRIKRTIIPGKSPKVLLEVYETVDGIEVERHDESRPKTDQQVLKKLIGDEQTFLSTVFYTHKSPEFIENKNAQRLDLMSKFLGLQPYEQKFALADNLLKEKEVTYKVLLKRYEDLVGIEKLQELSKLNSTQKEDYLNDSKTIETKEKQLSKTKKQLEEQLKAFNLIGVFKTEKTVLEEIELLNQTTIKLKKISETGQTELLDLMAKWNKSSPDKKVDEWVPNLSTILEHTNVLNKNKNLLSDWEEKLTNNICKSCGQTVKEIDKTNVNKQIKFYSDLVSEQEKELKVLTEKLKTLQDLKSKIQNIVNVAQLNNTKIENTSLKLEVLNSELNIIKDNSIKIQQREKILLELDGNTKSVQELIKKKAVVENELKNNEKERVSIDKQIVEYKAQKEKVLEANEQVSLYSTYKAMMHKTGIPLLILDTYIPLLNQEVNEYIYELFDFNLIFEIKENALDISFFYDKQMNGTKGIRDAFQASGMEGTIINLVTRAALYKISSLPKPSFLILDEIFTTVDIESLERLKEMLIRLKNQYHNILIISHIEDIKDLPEHNIVLEKAEGITTIL